MSGDIWALEVFRRAYQLSLEIHRQTLEFPKIEQYGGVADQLRRAAKSVCALLAEGRGRQMGSEREFGRYVIMALGSTDEGKLWCAYARDLGYAESAVADEWIGKFSEIARMLQGLHKHLSLTPDD